MQNYGGLRVGELAKASNLSRATVSHHLKILMKAGLIGCYEKGTMNFYHVDADSDVWGTVSSLSDNARALLSDYRTKRENGFEQWKREG